MKCPFCRVDNDRVVDSRASHDGAVTRRRRECLACGERFTTYEKYEEPELTVVKKDGGRVPFSREKIRSGLIKACWKRPISLTQIDALVSEVEGEAMEQSDGEIGTEAIGELVMRRLRELDHVAFVRFASVYRQFADVDDFITELRPFLKERRAKVEEG